LKLLYILNYNKERKYPLIVRFFNSVSAAHRNTWGNTVNIWTHAIRDRAAKTAVRAGYARVSEAAHHPSHVHVLSVLPPVSAKFPSIMPAIPRPASTVPHAISNRYTNMSARAASDTQVSREFSYSYLRPEIEVYNLFGLIRRT